MWIVWQNNHIKNMKNPLMVLHCFQTQKKLPAPSVIESIYIIIRDTDDSYRPIQNWLSPSCGLSGDSQRSDLVDRGDLVKWGFLLWFSDGMRRRSTGSIVVALH